MSTTIVLWTVVILFEPCFTSDDKQVTSLKLPMCQACKMVHDSFQEAMKQTARNHFGGGDTSWEEAKLGSYATSEIRLLEIQEILCRDKKAQDQCLTLVEEWELHLESWWLKDQKTSPDLFTYLCIDTLKCCCPSGHYGSDCEPCPGFPDNICNKKGQCKGEGTRKGNGKCNCIKGYMGKQCEKCDTNYFGIFNENKVLSECIECDGACKNGCTRSGPEGCNECAKGWILEPGKGCKDVDECSMQSSSYSLCVEDEVCTNTQGSYKCIKSDKTQSYSNFTRYIAYLGLCIATFIIFRSHPGLAGLFGLCVALYMTLCECMLSNLFANDFINTFLSYLKISR